MNWRTIGFGVHGARTFPQVALRDPDWLFWACESADNLLRDAVLFGQAKLVRDRASRIKIPNDPQGRLVARYVISNGRFAGLQIVPRDTPSHEGWGHQEIERPFIDLGLPRKLQPYDKRGGALLLSEVKPRLFPGANRLSMKLCNDFFENESNFVTSA